MAERLTTVPAHQFVVELQDRPGALAQLLEALARRGLDLRSIGASAIASHGAAVLVLNDAEVARSVLVDGRYTFTEGEVLIASAPDQPGAVASLARRLADAGVNLQGLAILGWHQGKAELALSVDKPDLARRALGIQASGGAVI
jgi:hypothetical protein